MTSSRLRPLIAGNWKMNGSRALTTELLTGLSALRGKQPDLAVDLLVCPPAPYLTLAAQLLQGSGIALGAQDCHAKASGAHTGDVAAPMLADCGCSAVILGHSERRADHGESSEHVATKAKAALDAGLTAIVCVGETEAERDRGATLDIVSAQLEGSIPADAEAGRLVVAYEPVWAIGTGRTASPEQAQAVHARVRGALGNLDAMLPGLVRILYGGSVKAANAAELFAQADIDGGLIGGAALVPSEFAAICRAANQEG